VFVNSVGSVLRRLTGEDNQTLDDEEDSGSNMEECGEKGAFKG